jgi:hypothetical protein
MIYKNLFEAVDIVKLILEIKYSHVPTYLFLLSTFDAYICEFILLDLHIEKWLYYLSSHC